MSRINRPSPPFRGESEGTHRASDGEGEVGIGKRLEFPTSPRPSPPPRAEREYCSRSATRRRGSTDVIAALTGAGVATLIDVRDRPISRRPGFSKRQLAASLEEAGIGYVGLTALGTPPEGREAGRKGDWERFWHIVGERLSTAEAEIAFAQAGAIARRCAELPALL